MIDEADLLSRLRAGEAAGFEELVRTYGGRMLAVARRVVRNEEDARDCVQDAFLQAFRSIERFEGRAALGTWLHRIVVNAALTRLRTKRRRPEISVEELLPSFDDLGYRLEPDTEVEPSAEARLESMETQEHVRDCIDALPDAYREIIQLRDLEGLDTADTADLMGISVGAAKTRLHRARAALKTLLERSMSGAKP